MNSLRTITALAAAALVAGCAQENVGTPPPTASFYFPTSVAAVESSTPGKPFLYVVSSNFDLRYSSGTVIAVDTSKLPEPPDGVLDKPSNPAVDPDKGYALIDSFGGGIATYSPASSQAKRLFVPTRAANKLYTLTAQGGQLSCFPNAATENGQDCLDQGLVLEDPKDSNIRTFDPFGVTVVGRTVYITHLHITDDPPLSGQNRQSYLASLDAENLSGLSFLPIGLAPAQGMAMTPNGLYLAGRALTSSSDQLSSQALRLLRPSCVDPIKITDGTCANGIPDGTESDVDCGGTCSPCPAPKTCNASSDCVSGVCTDRKCAECTVQDVGLTTAMHIYEARGVAASSDNARLFATTRSPDGLLVVDISLDPITGLPRNRELSFVSLPAGPAELLVIPRPGLRDLVVVSCTTSNSVNIYDDELGAPVGEIKGIIEPFGMVRSTIPSQPNGARVYVASFGNYTVDVIDILDVDRPRGAKVVGQIGLGAHRPLGIEIPEGAK
ncbi:MAG: hypothetical protein QM765_05840 [Myxococcales bacterium]